MSGTPKLYSELDVKTKDQPVFQVYTYRFFVILLFSMSAVNNVLMWLIWSPIQTLLQRTYGIGLTWANFATILISNVTYLPGSILANYVVDTYGLKPGVWLGCVLTGLGQLLRINCDQGFIWLFLGQFVGSFGQPFFYNTPQKISQVWFPANQRTICTAGITTFYTLAMAIGTVLPMAYVDPAEEDHTLAMKQLRVMMEHQFYFGMACYIPTFLFFRNEPPTPPSRAASAQKPDVVKSLKSLMRNVNYMTLLIGSSLIVASLINTISVMQALIEPWNIFGDSVGVYGGGGIAAGIATNMIFGIYISRTMKFRSLLLKLSLIGCFTLPGCMWGAEYVGTWLWGFVFLVYGATQSPLLAIGLEFLMEASFPVGEATAAGLVMILGQLFSTAESISVDLMIDQTKAGSTNAFWLMTFVQILGTVILVFVKEDLRRHKYEKGELKLDEQEASMIDPASLSNGKEMLIENSDMMMI